MEKMSLQDVADKLGISKQAIHKYETGATRPDSEMANKIAEAVNKTSN